VVIFAARVEKRMFEKKKGIGGHLQGGKKYGDRSEERGVQNYGSRLKRFGTLASPTARGGGEDSL